MIICRIKGGLGNQMFIYAFCRMLQHCYQQNAILDLSSVKEIYGLNFFHIHEDTIQYIEDKGYFKDQYPIRFFICRAVTAVIRLFGKKISEQGKAFMEEHLQGLLNFFGYYIAVDGYFPMRYHAVTKNIIADGFFQCERYFDEVADLVRTELRVKTPIEEKNRALLGQISKTNSVCVHIRRGDYCSEQNRNILVCDVEYYLRAFEKMKERNPGAEYFVFSDDIEWVKENIPFSSSVRYVEQKNSAHEELRLMYHCKHFIISNSSFSWWAQYLGDYKNKIVIAPDRWYNNKKKVDIFMSDWVLLNV